LSAIQRSDQKLWSSWIVTLTWSDQTSSSPINDYIATAMKMAFGTLIKIWAWSTLPHLRGGINTRREREKGLLFLFPKMSCMLLPPFLFLKWATCFCPFPPSQRELNKLCCTCLLRCESENGELERRLNSCKHEGSRGLKPMGNWRRRRRNLKRGRGRGKSRAEGEKYC